MEDNLDDMCTVGNWLFVESPYLKTYLFFSSQAFDTSIVICAVRFVNAVNVIIQLLKIRVISMSVICVIINIIIGHLK